MKIVLFNCLFLIIIISCSKEPLPSNKGFLVKGKVHFNGYENTNLYIKVINDSLGRWDNLTLNPFNHINIIDSIKIEEDGSYEKYLQYISYPYRNILLIFNDDITSHAAVIYHDENSECINDFYLQPFGYLKVDIKRTISSSRDVSINIYSENYLHYKHYFRTSLIDTSFVHRIIKDHTQVSHILTHSSIDEYEKYMFTKFFYNDYSDTIKYSIYLMD